MTVIDGTWTRRVAEATPAYRDRTVDALRALAMLGVVLGHWLVTAIATGPDGSLQPRSPLGSMPWSTPLSWVLETLGLFFFVSGCSTGLGLDRWRAGGRSTRSWLVSRLRRLVPPVLVFLGGWLLVSSMMSAFGANPATTRTVDTLMIDPLWFVGIMLVLLPLTPPVLALERRFGPASALAPLAVVTLVDLFRPVLPAPITWVNEIAAWLVPYVLGVSVARGRLNRRWGWPLAAAGLVLGVFLVTRAHYPASMVGVPGQGRSNLAPASLLVVALALVQIGVALARWDRIGRLMRRPAWWGVTVLLNLSAMTVFLWHQTALLLVTGIGHTVLNNPPGLIGAPDGLAWLGARLQWLPIFAAVLAGLWLLFRPIEALTARRRTPLR